MRIHQFPKPNTYARKLKAIEKATLHNRMPITTRKHALDNCHETRSLCKKLGNKWEFKSIPMDQKHKKKTTKECNGNMCNFSEHIHNRISLKSNTHNAIVNENQMVQCSNDTSHQTSIMLLEAHNTTSTYSSTI